MLRSLGTTSENKLHFEKLSSYLRGGELKWIHDDVIKWKHFPHYWPFVQGIQGSPVNSPHKGQWRGALMFSLICVWINGWGNNREAGDLRRYHAHYDVTVMLPSVIQYSCSPFSPWYLLLFVLSSHHLITLDLPANVKDLMGWRAIHSLPICNDCLDMPGSWLCHIFSTLCSTALSSYIMIDRSQILVNRTLQIACSKCLWQASDVILLFIPAEFTRDDVGSVTIDRMLFSWGCSSQACVITAWWHHDIESLSTLLALCQGIHWSRVDCPHKDPTMQSFYVCFVVTLNKLFGKKTVKFHHCNMWIKCTCCKTYPFWNIQQWKMNRTSKYNHKIIIIII